VGVCRGCPAPCFRDRRVPRDDARGVARTAIFLDDDERRFFLRLLVAVVHRYGWRCHVFCLMTNHYHLIVETDLWRLSAGTHRLNGVYAQAFNRRHNGAATSSATATEPG
jgi:REP element-mobilizing transposase RayT